MPRSMSSDRLVQWDDDSNRPHKKLKHSTTISETSVIEDDADSSTQMGHSIKTIPKSDRWVVTRYLGNSSRSSVYLAESTIEGEEDYLPDEMTIKSIEISQASRLMNEEKFLSRLQNPFVVSFYGHEVTIEKDEKDPLLEKMYYNTLQEYKKIIHCDIKPKNIILPFENNLFAQIAGFGKAIKKGSVEYGEGLGHRRGTSRLLPPEVMMDMVLDYGVDVWAFGCTVLEMLTGERVWSEFGKLDWEGWKTLIGESGSVPYIPNYLSDKAKDFLAKCLERDPSKRWSVDSLLEHEFLKWIDEDEEEEIYEEEEDDFYDGIEDVDEEYEANLEAEAAVEEEEAIEIDEEYPKEESEDDL
ncbi:Protein kinase domain [Arabidopsis thaliana x Arabidopsis arenosa]|uniref:Protein kinase domain-containing protein n=2 Tax=Arabidopsis TaxID=3701 RepID=A0A178VP42_ARATH|nr:Protein kinase domain [Arabidopsis thaliana x Arabidopsis arenosa]OAP06873.1 hypothetical protein AXX17_AT3G40020 [Arabidopsis thaliana]